MGNAKEWCTLGCSKVTAASFRQEVLESEKPVLVSFWVAWCTPFQQLEPILEALAAEYDTRLRICTVNMEEEQALAQRYGVANIPMLLLFHKGILVAQAVGLRTKQELIRMLNA